MSSGCAVLLSFVAPVSFFGSRQVRLEESRYVHKSAPERTETIPSRHNKHPLVRRRPRFLMSNSITAGGNSNAKLWASLSADSSALLSANFLSSTSEVYAVWSQRDVVGSRKRVFATSYQLSGNATFAASPPVEISDPSSRNSYFSPSRKKFVKFTSGKAGDGDAGPVIVEVWTIGGGLDCCWEVDPATHGVVYTDEWFGSVAWAPDESMVAYVADRPKPSYRDSPEDPQEAWVLPLAHKFDEKARDPFGEAYINRRSPTLFVADLTACRTFSVFDDASVEREVFFGEPQWSPDGQFIATTVRRTPSFDVDSIASQEDFLPSDLGLRYCYNRYSAIAIFRAPQSAQSLQRGYLDMKVISCESDADDFCCNSPRFSPDTKEVIYLAAPRFPSHQGAGRVLPHNTTKVLRSVRLNELVNTKPRTLIPVPTDPNHTAFPGLYLHALPENPWLDADTIVFSSTWGSVNRPLVASFGRDGNGLHTSCNSQVSDLSSDKCFVDGADNADSIYPCSSISLLDRLDDALLLAVSNPASPTHILSLYLHNQQFTARATDLVSPLASRSKKLSSFVRAWRTFDLVVTGEPDPWFSGIATKFVPGEHDSVSRFQATILLPQHVERKKTPLIVYPHGGPHVATLNGYSQGAMALLRCGFAVMYVNYRGSLGFGQKSLETLPGNVGTQDVNEIAQTTRWALLQEDFCLDAARVGFLGGSHSGFIGAHMSLIPGLYSRTVLRNPVVNIATMVGATDIPDWCFCEAALSSKNVNGVPLGLDAEQLRAMYELSPVSRVRPCKAEERPGPTLLQVGGSDRRVPPQQSLEWKRIMTQTYGSDSVTIRWYPDSGHAIDEVPNGDDAWVHALDFLCAMK